MKCPGCRSDLNVKETVHLAGRSQVEATVCVFCGAIASIGGDDAPPEPLTPCVSCGAPGTTPATGEVGECESCSETGASSRPLEETLEQVGAATLREALRLFPATPAARPAGYFEHVLKTLAVTAGEESASYRLILVSELGFRTLSVPAGAILAGTELVCTLEDEAMFAFALGREIVQQKSGRVFRRFRSRRPSGTLSAGFEWGLSLITGGDAAFGKRRAETLREVACLGYGPLHEENADALGIDLLVRAGYDPMAAVRYLTMAERRDLSSRGPVAAMLDVRPARSRRRELAQAIAAPHLGGATIVRLNREAYRRETARLASEGLLQTADRESAGRGIQRPD